MLEQLKKSWAIKEKRASLEELTKKRDAFNERVNQLREALDEATAKEDIDKINEDISALEAEKGETDYDAEVDKLNGEIEQLERELERANTSIMLSQIQPHFLYNALNTIKSLIRRDPEKAETAIIDFSLYLRGNMDSLTKVDPIPISEELDHIKNYCSLEQLRFSDKLEIFYDIECKDFYVPTLSVQPIVENAIKHGVTKKAEGGSVTISTYEDKAYYYICVEDDGVGFDVNNPDTDTSRSHVGIKNISERFKNIMNGEVEIVSEKGKGTTVTVKLPKDKNIKTLQESLEIMNSQSLLKEMNI